MPGPFDYSIKGAQTTFQSPLEAALKGRVARVGLEAAEKKAAMDEVGDALKWVGTMGKEDYRDLYNYANVPEFPIHMLKTPQEVDKMSNDEFMTYRTEMLKVAYDLYGKMGGKATVPFGDELKQIELRKIAEAKGKYAGQKLYGTEKQNVLNRAIAEELDVDPRMVSSSALADRWRETNIVEKLFARPSAHVQPGGAPGIFKTLRLDPNIVGMKFAKDGEIFGYKRGGGLVKNLGTDDVMKARALANEAMSVADTRKRQQATMQAMDLLYSSEMKARELGREEFGLLAPIWNELVSGKFAQVNNPKYVKFRAYYGLLPSLASKAHGMGATDEQQREIRSIIGSPVSTYENLLARFDALGKYFINAAQSVVKPRIIDFTAEGVEPAKIKFVNGLPQYDDGSVQMSKTGIQKADILINEIERDFSGINMSAGDMYEEIERTLTKKYKETNDRSYLTALNRYRNGEFSKTSEDKGEDPGNFIWKVFSDKDRKEAIEIYRSGTAEDKDEFERKFGFRPKE